MCYNVRRMSKQDSKVGVRELRQNLSVYLRRVRDGEALEVTDRGRSVALLVPLPAMETPLEKLVALGRASSPEASLLDLDPPAGEPTSALSDALLESRQERL